MSKQLRLILALCLSLGGLYPGANIVLKAQQPAATQQSTATPPPHSQVHHRQSHRATSQAAAQPPTTTLSNNNHYVNSSGNVVHSPAHSSNGVPAGATAACRDGSYSFSQHHQGTCSHHGGVSRWL
jgi:hypothetical protein